MKNQYRTGIKSRELILMKVQEHGRAVDGATLSALTGLKNSRVRYSIGILRSLGVLFLHHWEKNNSGRSKPFYFTEPSERKTVKGD